jgi:hypothetical protein
MITTSCATAPNWLVSHQFRNAWLSWLCAAPPDTKDNYLRIPETTCFDNMYMFCQTMISFWDDPIESTS